MKKKHHLYHLWLIFAAYGVYFALFSGLEELANLKWWKIVTALILGTLTYIYFEYKTNK